MTEVVALWPQRDAPLTEPEIVPALMLTGLHVDVSRGYIEVIGWYELPRLGGSEAAERRIITRLAMTVPAMLSLHDQIKRVINDKLH